MLNLSTIFSCVVLFLKCNLILSILTSSSFRVFHLWTYGALHMDYVIHCIMAWSSCPVLAFLITPLYCIQQYLTTNLSWTHTFIVRTLHIPLALNILRHCVPPPNLFFSVKVSVTPSGRDMISVCLFSLFLYVFPLKQWCLVLNQFICIFICFVSRT